MRCAITAAAIALANGTGTALHRLGLRFRVCRRDLPRKPDVALPLQRLVVQVRGGFWHQHAGCPAGRLPSSRLDYWRTKLEGNVRRDAEKDAALVAPDLPLNFHLAATGARLVFTPVGAG